MPGPGLANITILRSRPLGLGELAGLPPLIEIRFLARAKDLPFFFHLGCLFARANLLFVHDDSQIDSV